MVELHLSDCGITDIGVEALAQALKQQPLFAFNTITTEPSSTWTSSDQVSRETTSQFHGLEMLFLSHNKISDVGVYQLLHSIQPDSTEYSIPSKQNAEGHEMSNPFLVALDLTGNSMISSDAVSSIGALLSRPSIIQRRLENDENCEAKDLIWTELDDHTATHDAVGCEENGVDGLIGECVETNAKSANSLGGRLSVYIPPRCGALSLMGERLGDRGVTAIAESLRSQDPRLLSGRMITSLDLSHVGLTDKGLQYLTLSLQESNSRAFGLQKLFLSSNLINDVGMKSFNVSNNQVHDGVGCPWFYDLVELDLMHCGIGPSGIEQLVQGLNSGLQGCYSKMTTLHLHGNHLGDEGAISISKLLSDTPDPLSKRVVKGSGDDVKLNLIKLDLGMNGIGNVGG